jgi:hypothetical protein
MLEKSSMTFQTTLNTHDVLGVFQAVKLLKAAESHVVQALIRFGHRANMKSSTL